VEDLVKVRCAGEDDVGVVSSLLLEAVDWLEEKGVPLWDRDSLALSALLPGAREGDYWLFFLNDEVAGVLKFELDDTLYWPGFPEGEAAYVHKLVVCRRFVGTGFSEKMLDWAREKAAGLGLKYLRLDCEAARERLCEFYENYGFLREMNIERGGKEMARYQIPVTD
jgi:GNAT superfamily N-acetyltransferase